MWGGSGEINRFVDTVYGPRLETEFGIELNRIPVADTVDAVNKVLSEIQAGRDRGGAVDLIWINGENFQTLRQADALLGDWSALIPNARFVDWDAPEVRFDFGLPAGGYESPLGSAQFQFVYDQARFGPEELPRSYAGLLDWVKANPGRFTYPAPPDFHGNRFIKQAFYELTGGSERWLGGFDAAAYADSSPGLWAYLQEIEPYLWREGATYPPSIAELNRLFANGEIDFTFTAPGGDRSRHLRWDSPGDFSTLRVRYRNHRRQPLPGHSCQCRPPGGGDGHGQSGPRTGTTSSQAGTRQRMGRWPGNIAGAAQ